MRILGHDFELIPSEAKEELFALEREGAIYAQHWVDELDDFRMVRIALSPEEISEYVRSYWAYELFLRADSPPRATDVVGIPEDIAERADAYVLETAEGPLPDPPHHCPAAFLGPELESVVCFTDPSRRVILEQTGKEALLTSLTNAIDALTPSIRLFCNREKLLAPWPVQQEDDVRDLLYAMLRASMLDLVREEPTPSKANTHKFVDLCSRTSRLLLEVKWISRSGQWKQIQKQMNDDIQSYTTHPACEILVFVVVDAARDIPDPGLFQRENTGRQVIQDREVDIHTFVREP
ncbi:hypothetical protein ACFLQR_02910 [Verrucomicrobiota bacterium]